VVEVEHTKVVLAVQEEQEAAELEVVKVLVRQQLELLTLVVEEVVEETLLLEQTVEKELLY
jgi:hypothetical protein